MVRIPRVFCEGKQEEPPCRRFSIGSTAASPEPDATEPDATGPDATEPDATEPDANAPYAHAAYVM